MESLSHILKSLPDSEWKRKAETKIQGVLADPLIASSDRSIRLLMIMLMKINMNKLYQHVTEYKICSNCPGFDNCPNDMTGHYTILSAESVRGSSCFYP